MLLFFVQKLILELNTASLPDWVIRIVHILIRIYTKKSEYLEIDFVEKTIPKGLELFNYSFIIIYFDIHLALLFIFFCKFCFNKIFNSPSLLSFFFDKCFFLLYLMLLNEKITACESSRPASPKGETWAQNQYPKFLISFSWWAKSFSYFTGGSSEKSFHYNF